MKFLKEPTDKGLHIPRAALNLCGFEAGEKVELHTAENALVALKGRMTAMELLRAAQSLQQMAVELHTHLAKVCGPCDGCEGECPFETRDEDEIGLPEYLREEAGTLDNPRIEQLMEQLAGKLQTISGKKQYGYLKAPLKSVVDEIVDELAKDGRVAQAYDLWYELREEVLHTYKDDLPPRLPLSQQKEFKRIKNLVIQEAVRLGELSAVFAPPEPEETDEPELDSDKQYALGKAYRDGHGVEQDALMAAALFQKAAARGNDSAAYALAKLLLNGGDGLRRDIPAAVEWLKQSAEAGNQFSQYRLGKLLLQGENVSKDTAEGVRWLTASAERGNQYAQYALGKLYLLGKEIPKDGDAAVRWFTLAAAQGSEYAQYFLDHMDDFRGPSLFSCATRLLRHMSRIFQEQTPKGPARTISFTDKKLRQRIREKKIAMGHKADDYEERMQQI